MKPCWVVWVMRHHLNLDFNFWLCFLSSFSKMTSCTCWPWTSCGRRGKPRHLWTGSSWKTVVCVCEDSPTVVNSFPHLYEADRCICTLCNCQYLHLNSLFWLSVSWGADCRFGSEGPAGSGCVGLLPALQAQCGNSPLTAAGEGRRCRACLGQGTKSFVDLCNVVD